MTSNDGPHPLDVLDGRALLENLRNSAHQARTELVENKAVISEKELITALGEAQWQDLNAAIQAGRLFMVELDGVPYYPAFYAAQDLNRSELERVCQPLLGLSGWEKWVFLTTPKASLSGLTPLQALKNPGMFEAVLGAAYGYAER